MTTADRVLKALEQYDLKGRGNEYQLNSPLRPNSNSHGFTLKIDSGEYGTWLDHVTGEAGSLYELAERLGIETPKREKVENSKRAYSTLAEYAELKGVPEQVFIEAGWEVHTYFDNRPCFKFPTAGGERYRFIDGQSPAFKSIKGFEVCWYGLARAIKLAGKLPLILCNGEPSTIVAQHFGLPAFCMPGGENHKVTPELMAELKKQWKGSVRIALDCDEAGRKGTEKFVTAFTGAGVQYSIVDLMLTDKGDLADFCKLHGESSLTDFNALTPITRLPPPKPVNVGDLVKVGKELVNLRKGEAGNLEDTLNRLQDEIHRLRPPAGEVVTFEQVSVEYETWIKGNLSHAGTVQGFSTGMTKLDDLIEGIDRGMMYVVLAETGMGKSTCVASIASNLVNQAPGLVIPTESRALKWWNQIVAYRVGISKDKMRKGILEPNESARVYSTNALLRQQQCEVIECQNPTVSHIIETAKKAIAEKGCQWIILDSLSNVKAEGKSSIFDTVSEASDCAQELARMGLAVLSTSQVGRSLEGRDNRIPTLHDGKGSGRIEENADVVLALYNHGNLVKKGVKAENSDFPAGQIVLRCLKHREAGEKEGVMIQVKFKGGIGCYD